MTLWTKFGFVPSPKICVRSLKSQKLKQANSWSQFAMNYEHNELRLATIDHVPLNLRYLEYYKGNQFIYLYYSIISYTTLKTSRKTNICLLEKKLKYKFMIWGSTGFHSPLNQIVITSFYQHCHFEISSGLLGSIHT